MEYVPYVKLPEGIKNSPAQTILLQGTIGHGSDLLGKYHDLPTKNGGLYWTIRFCGQLFRNLPTS